MKPLTDTDKMPFGKYKDTPMMDVPASYLDWLMDQEWINQWPDVVGYIENNRTMINKELERQGLA